MDLIYNEIIKSYDLNKAQNFFLLKNFKFEFHFLLENFNFKEEFFL